VIYFSDSQIDSAALKKSMLFVFHRIANVYIKVANAPSSLKDPAWCPLNRNSYATGY